MRFPRVSSLLLALLLTACPGSNPPPTPGTDGGSDSNDAGDSTLTLSTETLPAATVSEPYRTTLAASGGSPAYSWHLVEGALPPGLTLSSSGEISGTPSTVGSASFTLEVRDSLARTARRTLSIEVRGSGFAVTTSALPDAYLGSEYPASLDASGGTAPYTWVIAGGALPSGLRLGASGHFSGSPVASGTFAVTVSVQDSAGHSARRDLTLSVFAPPSLSSTPLAPAVVGVPYSAELHATGGRGTLTFRISAGSLPEGLRLEGASVLGNPTAPGTASFSVEVQDTNDRATSASFQLSVRSGLIVTSTSLPDAYVDAAYSQSLSAEGGQPPYTWTLEKGPLPPGLRLLESGRLEGTPSSVSITPFTVRVTDAEGNTDTRGVAFTTYYPPALAAVPSQSVYVGDNVAILFSASLGKEPYEYSHSGSLPPGLTLAPQGILHGEPSAAGDFVVTVIASDANGRTASRSVSLAVLALPSITTTALPDGDPGRPYTFQLSATGGRGARTWSLASGTLPTGLSLASNGTVSGTPSAVGVFSFTVRVTDEGERTDSRALTLGIYAPPTVTTSALPDGYVGSTYSALLTAIGGRAPLSWSIDSGALPSGVTLAASTGAISGTPGTSATTFSVTVRATDSGGRVSAPRALTVTVYRPPVLSGVPLEIDAYVSEELSVRYTVTDGKEPYSAFGPSALPAWLVLTSSGELFGTPPFPTTATGQVSVSDANGRTATRAFAITAYARPVIADLPLPEGRIGEPYSASLLGAGGKPPLTWSILSGSLPSGLTLASDGSISGTPGSGTSSFTARIFDVNGRTATRTLTIPVYVPPAVTTSSLPDAVIGQPYSATLTASNGRAPLSWSHTGSLPAGLSLSSTGVLSGTPTAAGTSSFTVTVLDANSLTATRGLSLTVRGSASAPFTVGHWNIEWFGAPNQGPPRSTSDGGTPDDLQIAHARDVLGGDAGVNLWGLVEMVDANDFAILLAQLPHYSGFLANDTSVVFNAAGWYSSGEQKPGILYDSSLTFQGAQLILTEAAADFGGRPPLRVDFTLQAHGAVEPLIVIILHMKAFEDTVSYSQRQRSSIALKDYLDAFLPFERVLVIGDWNDDVDHSITRVDGTSLTTPFENFLLDPADYTFVTRPLTLAGERTTTSYPDAIDHTLATNEMFEDYIPGSVRVLRPAIPDYANTVSDHYPVISRYDLSGGGGGNPGPSSASHLFINELLANEPSMDGGVGDAHYEFIEVVNAGTTPADLSGWSLSDATAARHVFASGTTLAPGRAFVVFGGPRGFPPGTPDTVAASNGQLGLNNDGDTASLRQPDGGTADSVTYTATTDNVSINRRPDAVPDAGLFLHTTLNPGLGSSPGRRADGGTF